MLATLVQLPVPPVAPVTTDTTDQLATPSIEWAAMAPMLILMVGALAVLLLVTFAGRTIASGWITSATVAVAGASLGSTYPIWNRVGNPEEGPISAVAGAVGIDGFSIFVIGVLAIATIMASLLSHNYLAREELKVPELHPLLLLAASGGALMASANDLIVLFIGLEVLSIATYVMAAVHSRRMSSGEAAFKYFILGAFASAFFIYGIAMMYGATGSTSLIEIQRFLSETVVLEDGLLLAGIALMLVGFGFKVAAAPFHMWAPDVYQGAPSPVTAFMASAVKVGAFAGLLRVVVVTLPTYADFWKPMVFALAVASLVIGSVMAVVQTNVKRMLAYSSVAHAGFMLVAIESGTAMGTSAVLFYMIAYTAMAAGSFGVVSVVGRQGDGRHHIDDYKGLGAVSPTLAMTLTVLLLAQAGTPLTAGFMAKFSVINAAVDSQNYTLATIAMVTSVISAFLYLRIVVAMHFSDPDPAVEIAVQRRELSTGVATRIALGVAVALTLVLGIVPGVATSLTDDAVPVLVEVPTNGPTAQPAFELPAGP